MSYSIDQSGKIEQTNKDTIVAVANGTSLTVKITSVEKRKLIKSLSLLKRPHKTYIIEILSVLIYVALRGSNVRNVVIDTEYLGHNASIKEKLIQLFQKTKSSSPNINFGFIGKHTNAHIQAIETFRGNKKATIILKAENILKILINKNTKKGWRSRSSRENL